MDINFPLFLVVSVFVGIIIWLIDIFFLLPLRKKATEELDNEFRHKNKSQSAEDEYQKSLERINKEPYLVEFTKSVLPVLIVVLVVRSFIVEPFKIPSSSMEDTLLVGDFILVNKFTYGIRLPVIRNKIIEINEPKRGDVMVFFPPNDSRYFIKRVIGIPGDRIVYRNKTLFVNGIKAEQTVLTQSQLSLNEQRLQEQFSGNLHQIKHTFMAPARDFQVIVKPGHYFMMGDNRDNSNDSRYWGQVPEENIVGKAFAIWMHWDKLFSLPSFSRVGSIQ